MTESVNKSTSYTLCATALGAALISICAWISVPMGGSLYTSNLCSIFGHRTAGTPGRHSGRSGLFAAGHRWPAGIFRISGWRRHSAGCHRRLSHRLSLHSPGRRPYHKASGPQSSSIGVCHDRGTSAVLCLWFCLVSTGLHPFQRFHRTGCGIGQMRCPLSSARRRQDRAGSSADPAASGTYSACLVYFRSISELSRTLQERIQTVSHASGIYLTCFTRFRGISELPRTLQEYIRPVLYRDTALLAQTILTFSGLYFSNRNGKRRRPGCLYQNLPFAILFFTK